MSFYKHPRSGEKLFDFLFTGAFVTALILLLWSLLELLIYTASLISTLQ